MINFNNIKAMRALMLVSALVVAMTPWVVATSSNRSMGAEIDPAALEIQSSATGKLLQSSFLVSCRQALC